MFFIVNAKTSSNKLLKSSLKKIVGLGNSKINYLLKKTGISNTVKLSDLSNLQTEKLQTILKKSNFKIDRNFKRYQQQFLKHLKEIKKYKYIKKKNKTRVKN